MGLDRASMTSEGEKEPVFVWALQGFGVFGLSTLDPKPTCERVGDVVLHFHVHEESR